MPTVNVPASFNDDPGPAEGVRRSILIDGRPLLSSHGGGIFEYTSRLVEALRRNSSHRYHVWANQYRPETVAAEHQLVAVDSLTRWPNKLLHAGIRFTEEPWLDQLVDAAGNFDLFWAPNLHFISLSPELPLALTIHDLSFERYPEFFSLKQRLWHQAVGPKQLCGRADAILAASNHTKRDLVDLYGLAPEKIAVTHEGCGDEFFKPISPEQREKVRSRLNLPARFILQVGALEPRKNHLSTIKAFDLITRNTRYNDLHLVLVGPRGWNNRNILKAIEQSPRRDRIHWIGFIDRQDKPVVYQLAEAFVFPSFYEGFGLPPLEAMAVGTPVIASSSASLGEVIEEAGVLIDPYRPVELAEAIQAVIDSPSLKETLSVRGRRQAEKFTWSQCAQKTADVFSKVCGH